MNKKLIVLLSSTILFVLPIVAFGFNPGGTPNTVILNVTQIVNIILDFIWPIFAGFAVIMFLYAGFLFLTASGEAEKIANARQALLWGTVGVVVGLIAFSIPFIIRTTVGNGI